MGTFWKFILMGAVGKVDEFIGQKEKQELNNTFMLMGSQEEIMAFLFNPNRRFTFKMLDELSRIENQQFRK